jgi:hypothetical protein
MLPCFSKIKEETFLTIDLRTAFKIKVKIRLNKREFILRKTLEESSLVLALLESELESEFMYI